MKRRKLVRFREEPGAPEYLGYQGDYPGGSRPAGENVTLEELADLCDQQAEQANAHDFAGAHRLLAVMLCRHVGRAKATAAMREIAKLGGLDGMNGVCSGEDAYGLLKIPRPGKEWNADG